MPRIAIVASSAVLLFGFAACGDDDAGSAQTGTPPSATAAATEVAPEPAELGAGELSFIRDALAVCLTEETDFGGVMADYKKGKADAAGAKVETDLAAPDATKAAIDEGARYLGLRDDKAAKGTTPNWDVLVYPSEAKAKEAYPALSEEVGDPAGAWQSGRLVTVAHPDADSGGDDPDASDAALTECQRTAELANVSG